MSNSHDNVVVEIDQKGAERAIRKFKRMCESFGISKEYKNRKEYKKPSVKKKEKLAAAKKRNAKADRKTKGGRKI
tara:strand:+ start:65609 stop:65833 length:225 start_codon:yes stop_codon:yes gene_type:complete